MLINQLLLKYMVDNIFIEITSFQLSFIFIFPSSLIYGIYSGQHKILFVPFLLQNVWFCSFSKNDLSWGNK